MKNILFLFTICAFLSSCNNSNKAATTPTVVTNTSDVATTVSNKPDNHIKNLDDNPVFYLNRESCRGACPGYTYTIFESGKVDYYGLRHVDRIGNHIATMDKATLASLIKAAEDIELKKMDEEYIDKHIMDIPSITLKYGEKSVKFFDHLAPENLKRIFKQLDDALDTLSWEKIDE